MLKASLEEYRISIKKIFTTEVNGYSGITLLFVIKGHVEIISSNTCIRLEEQQIYLINKNVAYILSSNQDNILISLEISNSYILRYYPVHLTSDYYLSPTKTDLENSYLNDAMLLIAKITVTHIQKNPQYLLNINRLLSELLLIITSFCQVESNNAIQKHSAYSPKIEKITQYIKDNYNRKLSLQEIAKNEYISFSHLSRVFKKEVGIGFSQYVNQLKFEYTLSDLINTSKRVYQIAEDHGFSNIKQFILQFKKLYGSTPTQFRKNHHQEVMVKTNKPIEPIVTDIELSDVIYRLSEIIHNPLNPESGANKYNQIETQEIIINNNKTNKLPEFCYTLFVGDVTELLKQEIQQQLLIVKQEIAVQYVEVTHLITGNSILPEFATDEYISTYNPYSNTDAAISFLHKQNISLCIRINHDHICHDIETYIKKFFLFLEYYTHFLGYEYIKKWRFIYYFENTSQIDSPEFETAFNQLFNIIKGINPTIKLGIFYPFIYRENYKNEPFFQHKMIHKCDFFGYSAYFDEKKLLLENEENIRRYAHFIYLKTTLLKKGLTQNGLNQPLYLMQWNTLSGNTRKTNGRFFRGSILLKTLLDLSNDINNISLILNTNSQQEVREKYIDTTSIALFFIHETRRPIFFILKFIQKLKGKIICKRKNYLVTQDGGNYQIIIANVSIFNPYLSIREHLIQSFKRNKLLTIKGIPSGNYQVKRYLFDQEHGGLYKHYEKFQTKYGQNQEVFEYLAQVTKPKFSIKDEYIDINSWQILTELDINAIDFYELNLIKF